MPKKYEAFLLKGIVLADILYFQYDIEWEKVLVSHYPNHLMNLLF